LSEITPNTFWMIGALVLAISALSIRKLSVSTVVRAVAGWAVIALIVILAVSHRYEIGSFFASVGNRLGISSQQVAGDTVRIRMSPDGHFWAQVSVNGVRRRMLIDSGATITAISENTAEVAGISTEGGFPVMLETANGTVTARRGRIDELRLETLTTEDLTVVVAPNFRELDVLGMNFLSRLGSWRVEGRTLILEPGNGGAEDIAPSEAVSDIRGASLSEREG